MNTVRKLGWAAAGALLLACLVLLALLLHQEPPVRLHGTYDMVDGAEQLAISVTNGTDTGRWCIYPTGTAQSDLMVNSGTLHIMDDASVQLIDADGEFYCAFFPGTGSLWLIDPEMKTTRWDKTLEYAVLPYGFDN